MPSLSSVSTMIASYIEGTTAGSSVV